MLDWRGFCSLKKQHVLITPILADKPHAKGEAMELARTINHHGAKTFAAILVIVMLSVADAFLTLDLVHRGEIAEAPGPAP